MFYKKDNFSILLCVFVILSFSSNSFAVQKLKAVAISGGEGHSLVVTNNNEVFACGDNDYAQLGNGTDSGIQSVLKRVLDGEMNTATNLLENITGSGKQCAIYPVRPSQCRSWPFWPENILSPEDWQNTAVKCPGINTGKLYTFEEIESIHPVRYSDGGK